MMPVGNDLLLSNGISMGLILRLKLWKVSMTQMMIVRRWKQMEAHAYARAQRNSVIHNFTQVNT